MNKKPTIYIGTDHAGFKLKEKLVPYIKKLGYEVIDKGATKLKKGDDYPDFIAPVARAVKRNPKDSLGIILGGSGQGEAMVANRHKGVRATVYYGGPLNIIKLSKEHNNANVLSIGARFVSEKKAKEIIKLWLMTKFSGEARHKRRLKKLDK